MAEPNQPAVYEIETPDGRVFQVEGPADATPAQIEAFAKAYLARAVPGNQYKNPVFDPGGPSQAPERDRTAPAGMEAPVRREPEAAEVPWTDQSAIGQMANSTAGVIEGAGEIFDAPARLLGSGLAELSDLVNLPEWVGQSLRNPVTIRGAVESAVPPSQTRMGQMFRAAGQGMGAAMTGVGTGMAIAKTAASPVSRAVGETMASLPGQQAASGIAAGVAADGARQLGAPVPVQIGAGIVAGGATPSALRGIAGGTDAMVDRLTAPGLEREAAQYVRGNMTRPEAEVLASIDAAPVQQTSGARPTLAEVTLDPGLAAMQRGVVNLSGTRGGQIAERIGENARLRLRAVDEALGPGNPADIERAAALRERTLGAQTAEAVERVGPLVAPDEAGASARGSLSSGYQFARARTADAYGNPILEENPPIQLRPLDRSQVELPEVGDTRDLAAFQEQSVRAYRSALPPRPRTLLQFVRAKGGVAADSMGADDLRSAGMDARGQPTLVREDGVPLDRLREAAAEAGYISPDTDLAEFTALLQAEYAGARPVYAIGDDADLAAYEAALRDRSFWRQQFDERELDPTRMSNEDWVRFYNEVEGSTEAAGRTLDDLQREQVPGSLMGPFQQTIASLRNRYFGEGGAEASPSVRAFLNDVLAADEVGLKTLEGWERQALDLARNAPDKTTAASLQAIARAIGAKASQAGGPERRAALDAARTVRREQGEVFEQGPVGRVLQREDYGRFAVPDSDVGRVLVPRGRTGGETADQLLRAAPEGAEGIARAELRRALDDATGDPRQIARVARDYREAISRFPSLERDVRLARQNAVLSSRFRSSQLGRFLQEGKDPAQAVAQLLTVKDGGNAFRSLVNGPGMTPPAVAGVRRGIAEHIKAISRSSTIDADLQTVPITRKVAEGIVQTLSRTKGTTVLSGNQRAVLNAVRRELRADQFARSANRPSGSDTARNINYSLQLFEGAMNMAPDTGGVRNVIQFIFRHVARTEDIMAVVANAVEDPKFAAELLRKPTADRVARVLEGVRAYNQGAALGAVASAESGSENRNDNRQ